jgi:hypothetical protein
MKSVKLVAGLIIGVALLGASYVRAGGYTNISGSCSQTNANCYINPETHVCVTISCQTRSGYNVTCPISGSDACGAHGCYWGAWSACSCC